MRCAWYAFYEVLTFSLGHLSSPYVHNNNDAENNHTSYSNNRKQY